MVEFVFNGYIVVYGKKEESDVNITAQKRTFCPVKVFEADISCVFLCHIKSDKTTH